MTYKEAREAGYIDGDMKYTAGYISRKTNIDNQPVKVAGGSRKGQLYILVPCWHSTTYCFRLYLKKNIRED